MTSWRTSIKSSKSWKKHLLFVNHVLSASNSPTMSQSWKKCRLSWQSCNRWKANFSCLSLKGKTCSRSQSSLFHRSDDSVGCKRSNSCLEAIKSALFSSLCQSCSTSSRITFRTNYTRSLRNNFTFSKKTCAAKRKISSSFRSQCMLSSRKSPPSTNFSLTCWSKQGRGTWSYTSRRPTLFYWTLKTNPLRKLLFWLPGSKTQSGARGSFSNGSRLANLPTLIWCLSQHCFRSSSKRSKKKSRLKL